MIRLQKLVPAALLLAGACVQSSVVATPPVSTRDMSMAGVTNMSAGHMASAATWTDLVVPGFPSGAKMAVLSGNPGAAEPYVLRLMFPDGYEFPEHWHPGTEDLTVLSGSFHLAMANPTSGPLHNYAPGDFIHIPARMSHSGGATGTTIIQLHGTGPFAINLGKP
jgi:quercetin dioxygenase-like cupin family protein